MAAFASTTDLEDYLQVTFDATDNIRAGKLLDHASAVIRRAARQDFDFTSGDTVALAPTGTDTLLLPQLPVTAVASVTVDGVVLTTDVDYRVALPAGILRRLGAGRWNQPVDVVYSHGYTALPEDLKAICVEMSARAWVNPRGVISEQIGNYSARWSAEATAGMALDDDEMMMVKSYRAVPG